MSERLELEKEGSFPMVWIVVLLVIVIGMLGLGVWWLRDVKSKVTQLPLIHLGSGTMTMDGSEQTIFEFSRLQPFKFSGHVDFRNMVAGDKITLSEYVKIKDGGSYGLYASADYSDVQAEPMTHIKDLPDIYGVKVTLKQTAGVYRKVDWEFYMGLTS